MIVALVNNKGGVGKTTTAVNLAAGVAAQGQHVLLVDLDSQASASLWLGIARPDLEPSSADLLLDGHAAKEVICPTRVERLDLLTGSMRLANADVALASGFGREYRLKNALAEVQHEYGLILLDCPPSLSLLSVNALVAADAFVVPVTPDYLAVEGLVSLLEAVERIRQGIGTAAQLAGIVLTLVDYRAKVTSEIVSMLRKEHGDRVFDTEVRVNVRLKEAPSFAKTIFDYDRSCTGTSAYLALTDELVHRLKGLKSSRRLKGLGS